MANSVANVQTDVRIALEKNPVWKQVTTFIVEAGGGHAEISKTIQINGILLDATIEVGSAAGISGTANVDFDDSSGVEFSANATLAEGSETVLAFFKAVTDFAIRVDVSAAPTSSTWTITVTTRGI